MLRHSRPPSSTVLPFTRASSDQQSKQHTPGQPSIYQPPEFDFNNYPLSAYPVMPSTETLSPHVQSQQLPMAHPRQAQFGQQWQRMYNSAPRFASHLDGRPDDEFKEFQELYARIYTHEGFRTYRENQESKLDKKDAKVWPEALEQAFFRAIVRWPPMGRGKQLHKEKAHGRNELIADYISEVTGGRRDRKQVSSHIQVLKNFFENDPFIMKYFPPKSCGTRRGRSRESSTVSYGSARNHSNYPIHTRSRAQMPRAMTYPGDGPATVYKADVGLDLLRPVDFQMFAQRKSLNPLGQEELECLHTYTKPIQSPAQPDLAMADWQSLEQDYPLLAEMHASQRLDCNVVIAEASISIPEDPLLTGNSLPGDVDIGIALHCTSSGHHSLGTHVKCRNTVYRNGKYIDTGDSGTNGDHFLVQLRDVPSCRETRIKFGNTFWTQTLTNLGRLFREAASGSPEARETAKNHLREVTMIQEIFAVSSDSHGERVLIMHWTFRLAQGPQGRVSWSRLLLPAEDGRRYTEPGCDQYMRDTSVSRLSDQHGSALVGYQSLESEASSLSALDSEPWTTGHGDANLIDRGSVDSLYAPNPSFDLGAHHPTTFESSLSFNAFDNEPFGISTRSDILDSTDGFAQSFSQPYWCSNLSFPGQQSLGSQSGYGSPTMEQNDGHAYGGMNAIYDQTLPYEEPQYSQV